MARPHIQARNPEAYEKCWALWLLGVPLLEIAAQTKLNHKVIENWSHKNDWIEARKKILDRRMIKVGKMVLDEQDAIKGQERDFAEQLMAMAAQTIASYTPAKLKKIRPGDLVKILELASKLSRLSVGLPLGSTQMDVAVRHDLGDSIKLAIEKVYGQAALPEAKLIEIAVDTTAALTTPD